MIRIVYAKEQQYLKQISNSYPVKGFGSCRCFFLTIIFLPILMISCLHKVDYFINIERKGGFSGLHEEISIRNKTAIYRDKKSGMEKQIELPDEKVKMILEILENIKEESEAGFPVYPDCIIFEIFFKINNKMKKVAFCPDPSNIESDLGRVAEFINEIIKEARKTNGR